MASTRMKMGAEAVAHHASNAPKGLGHPSQGDVHLLAGSKPGGPMTHSTGSRMCGDSRDYDPPGADTGPMSTPGPSGPGLGGGLGASTEAFPGIGD